MFNINSIDSYASYNDEFFLHDNYLDTSSELDLSELKHFGASSSRAQSVDMDVTPLSSSKSSSSESSSSESNFELDGPEADFFKLIQPVVDL